MIALGEEKRKAYEERLVGTTVEVLMEEPVTVDGEVYQAGHTREYVKVGLKTEENMSNRLVNVEIENHLQILR